MLTEQQREVFTELKRSYGKRYNDGRGFFDGYKGRGHWENRARWIATAQTICRYNPSTALDLGCGRGTLVEELRRRGIATFGCDLGEDVRTAWGVVASACELPFRKRFDVVIALDIIEHIPWDIQEQLFAELRRVTGRLMIVTVPTEEPHYRLTSAVPARNHYLCLPENEWARLFEREGFTVEAEGGSLATLGPPFGFGATNYPFILKPSRTATAQ